MEVPPIDPFVLEYFVKAAEGQVSSDFYQVLICACLKGPIARRESFKPQNLILEDFCMALSEVSPIRFSLDYIHQVQHVLSHNFISVPWSSPPPPHVQSPRHPLTTDMLANSVG